VSGAALEVDLREFSRLRRALLGMSRTRMSEVLDTIGAQVESQTQRRISSERRAPDGAPWKPWSDEYAKTRHGGQDLLQGEGDLLQSIIHNVLHAGMGVEIGSNEVYAAIHNFGGNAGRGHAAKIPQRQFLGLSPSDEKAILGVVDDFLNSRMRREGL
jgi:phage virion morphogenesis protein